MDAEDGYLVLSLFKRLGNLTDHYVVLPLPFALDESKNRDIHSASPGGVKPMETALTEQRVYQSAIEYHGERERRPFSCRFFGLRTSCPKVHSP